MRAPTLLFIIGALAGIAIVAVRRHLASEREENNTLRHLMNAFEASEKKK